MSRELGNLPPNCGKLEENSILVAKSLEIHLNEKGFSSVYFVAMVSQQNDYFSSNLHTLVVVLAPSLMSRIY